MWSFITFFQVGLALGVTDLGLWAPREAFGGFHSQHHQLHPLQFLTFWALYSPGSTLRRLKSIVIATGGWAVICNADQLPDQPVSSGPDLTGWVCTAPQRGPEGTPGWHRSRGQTAARPQPCPAAASCLLCCHSRANSCCTKATLLRLALLGRLLGPEL